MKKIRAVLFDLDGTLCDTQGYILHAYSYALTSAGFKLIDEKDIAKNAGMPLRYIYPVIAPGCDVQKMISLHREYQLRHLNEVQPYPGLRQILSTLQRSEVKLAIVTGRYRVTTEKILQLFDIEKFFSVVVAGDDDGEGKPHPAPFLKAAKLLAVRPSECLVVGDGASDMESGRKAGCIVARAVYGYAATEPTPHAPDFKINSLSEILQIVEKA